MKVLDTIINTVFGRRKTKLGGTRDVRTSKTTPLLPDWKEFYQVRKPEKTQADTHRSEATPLLPVWKEFQIVTNP
jgi:hypothetical protein